MRRAGEAWTRGRQVPAAGRCGVEWDDGDMRADARANRQDLLAAAGRLIATQGAAMSLRGVA